METPTSYPPARAAAAKYQQVIGDFTICPLAPVLHPSTDPERIRAVQQDDVRYAVEALGTLDVDVLSDWLILPTFNIRRALDALGLVKMQPRPAKEKKPPVLDRLKALLAGRTLRLDDLAARSGAKWATVTWTLQQNPAVFEAVYQPGKGRKPVRCWRLREPQGAATGG